MLVTLVPHTEFAARADLAERLSLLANAPRGLVGQLAHEDEIAIAGPLLRRSPVIDEQMLIEIASAKGQGHLLAMSERSALSPDLTDVIVRRGDRDVVRRAAGNAGALFSTTGYSTLIKRAGQDGVLTLAVGQRDDLSAEQLKDLLAGSIDVVRRRLFDLVKPARQSAIKRAMNEISGCCRTRRKRPRLRAGAAHHPRAASRRPTGRKCAAQLCQGQQIRGIDRRAVGDDRRQDRTLDRLISGDRYDPILIVGKAIGLEWATVRALILLRLGPNRVPSPADIESARVNFARLMPSTAERVVGFWKTRPSV